MISWVHPKQHVAFAPLLIPPLFLVHSKPHEGDAHGRIHSLSAQRLQWERVRGTGLLASRGPARRHPHQRLHRARHPPAAHRVRNLQDGTGRQGQVLALQWPEAQRRVQPRPTRKESHVLPDAFNSVRFVRAQI